MDELKRCPFCGGDDAEVMTRLPIYGEQTTYYVICRRCGAKTAFHVDAQWAKKAWNRRADDV